MGCQVTFPANGELLCAVVSGRSSAAEAAWVARAIAEEASEHHARRILIDLRRVDGRLGVLRTLAMAEAHAPSRVAVLDAAEYDGYYALHEAAARLHGVTLRRFSGAAEALDWLSEREAKD